jgi:hypothetical protein
VLLPVLIIEGDAGMASDGLNGGEGVMGGSTGSSRTNAGRSLPLS